jgi:hypothetical protein
MNIEEMLNDFLFLTNNELELKYNKKYDTIRKICNKLGIKKGPPKNNDKFISERTENIIKKCKNKKYKLLNFENGKYENSYTKFKLECNIDGYIWETNYNKFINQNTGCHKCYNQHKKDTNEIKNILETINKKCMDQNYELIKICDNKMTSKTKIILRCKKDDYSWNTTLNHFINRDQCCSRCIGRNKTTQEVINEIEIKCSSKNYTFLGFNDYYKNNKSKFKLKCIYNHTWETYYSNFINNNRCCPTCSESRGEKIINDILNARNIEYIREAKFDNCIYKRQLRFDFYLPKFNTCIEFDGIQHFEPVKRFGGEYYLSEIIKKDYIKNKYCEDNNIKLIRIKYNQNTDDIISVLNHILN